jgi:hypothetical protein
MLPTIKAGAYHPKNEVMPKKKKQTVIRFTAEN